MPTEFGLSSREVLTIVNRYIGVSGGYLGDFSYRTHYEFYRECDLPHINPDSDEYSGTTRQRFIQILESRSPRDQAAIVRGVVERFGDADADDAARTALRATILEWANLLEGASPVRFETPSQTRAVVVRALDDAQALLATTGPTSVVDRIHTALHGHLHALCEQAGITAPTTATLQGLLHALRSGHPALDPTGPRADDVSRVLFAMGTIMDALNPLRNRASAAHPNIELLDSAEAMLVVNTTRTILAYLDSRLRGAGVAEPPR